MYPDRELNRLAVHKAGLQQRIVRSRHQWREAGARVVQPLAFLDRLVVLWRRFAPIAPLAAVPLGFVLKRFVAPRRKLLGTVLRLAPTVLGLARGFARGRARS